VSARAECRCCGESVLVETLDRDGYCMPCQQRAECRKCGEIRTLDEGGLCGDCAERYQIELYDFGRGSA
jgi:hypothetical protein